MNDSCSDPLDPTRGADSTTKRLLAAQAQELAALKAQVHRLQEQIEQLAGAPRKQAPDPALAWSAADVREREGGHHLPLVSIITPCLNHARYIRETVESVLAQDYPSVEHIVVDGGSVDGTVAILRDYAAQYPARFRWISEPDSGQSDAVNKGLALAQGEIIGWQNSDDYYYPNVFAEPVRYLIEHPDVGVVYSDCNVVDLCRNVTGKFSVCPFDLPLLLRMTCVANQSAFIRRDLFQACGALATDYHYAMDHHLWLRLALTTQFAYLPGVRGAFRVQPRGKVHRGYLWNRLEVVRSLESLAGNPLFPAELLPELHQGVAQFALQAMKLAILEGRADVAERSLAQAIEHDPQLERFTDLCTKLVEGLVTAAKASAPEPPAIGGALPRVALSALQQATGGRPAQRRKLRAIEHLYRAFAARGHSHREALAHVRRAVWEDPWWLALDEVVQLALAAAGCRWAAAPLQKGYPYLRRVRGSLNVARRATQRSALPVASPPPPAKAPVAFVIYNRPEQTRAVFERIRRYAPPELYVIADGARDADDARLCAETRDVVTSVDWACVIRTSFANENMGCARRVPSGLDWVFSQCEAAIILEDDVVPDPSFFAYCNELLERYRHDARVGMICGNNLEVRSNSSPATSYYFARSVQVWGWATWRRTWQDYDHAMTLWPELRDRGWLREVHQDPVYAGLLATLIDGAYNGYSDSWSFRWMLSFWLNEYLAILPNTNLVTNIGFGPSATHTRSLHDYRSYLRSRAITFPLVHPEAVLADQDADRRLARRHMEEEHHLYRGKAGRLRRARHTGQRFTRSVWQGMGSGLSGLRRELDAPLSR